MRHGTVAHPLYQLSVTKTRYVRHSKDIARIFQALDDKEFHQKATK